ncbi:MAG: hypothetical protein IKF00_06110 [Solobacterium sp.]|jgi:DNA-binding XRE family transcriptional regulator|nr:hypothetical protein [Solobacterium sp.]HAE15473.1 transcriptional regulator [Erysipelotrichaceae bacterium]
MEKEELITMLSNDCRLVRTEFGFSQDQMAKILGMSKKTLVETEKGRRTLSWPECIALAVIFAGSQVLSNEFGGELSDMIRAVSFDDVNVSYPKTMGGKIWWRDIYEHSGYRVQQNLLSQHYRLLDPADGRMVSSFDLEVIRKYMRQNGLLQETEEL